MSYILKHNGVEVASCPHWNPTLFGDLSQTSFPKQVEDGYTWNNGVHEIIWVEDPAPIQPTAEEIAAQLSKDLEIMRLEAYRNESDPLFFKWQRDEVEKQVWLDKVAEIKARYPGV